MLRTTFIAALAALAGAVSPVGAQDFLNAQAPSHNIACQAESAGPDNPRPQLRCDIQQTASRLPRAPASCPLSWGDAFVLDPTGPGRLLCHGDTVADPSARVIPYGTQWRPYGFTCTSQTTGMTCVNEAGHGFTLSRAVQKTF
jgi:uncharacterized protein DUF6636